MAIHLSGRSDGVACRSMRDRYLFGDNNARERMSDCKRTKREQQRQLAFVQTPTSRLQPWQIQSVELRCHAGSEPGSKIL